MTVGTTGHTSLRLDSSDPGPWLHWCLIRHNGTSYTPAHHIYHGRRPMEEHRGGSFARGSLKTPAYFPYTGMSIIPLDFLPLPAAAFSGVWMGATRGPGR